jgi:hypothetical protein
MARSLSRVGAVWACVVEGHRWPADSAGDHAVCDDQRACVEGIELDPNANDLVICRWCSLGTYSASTTYAALFVRQATLLGTKQIWKIRAPSKCNMFLWLILQDRCWTSDRLQRHDLNNHGLCALCAQTADTIDHLLLGYS